MSFLSKGQLFSIFCQLSSFTISEHAEICISCHFCFIICVKACSGTVSNFLTFRIPLNGTIKKKNSTKNNKNDNDKKNSNNNALRIYRNYLPK